MNVKVLVLCALCGFSGLSFCMDSQPDLTDIPMDTQTDLVVTHDGNTGAK